MQSDPQPYVQVGANQAYVEAEFGGPVEQSEDVVSLTTTITRIVDNDPEAVSLFMINIGTDDCFVYLDDKVSDTRGILLQANGGSIGMNVRNDQDLPARAWWAVSKSGGTFLLYIRNRRYAYSFPAPPAQG